MLGRPTFYLPSSSFREICLPILSDGTTAFCNCFPPHVLFPRDCFSVPPPIRNEIDRWWRSFGRLSNEGFLFSSSYFTLLYYLRSSLRSVRVCECTRIKKIRKDGCLYFEGKVELESVNKIYVSFLIKGYRALRAIYMYIYTPSVKFFIVTEKKSYVQDEEWPEE